VNVAQDLDGLDDTPQVVRPLATRSAGEALASRWSTTWALATQLRRLAATRTSWSHCSPSKERSRPARRSGRRLSGGFSGSTPFAKYTPALMDIPLLPSRLHHVRFVTRNFICNKKFHLLDWCPLA
jgi:hypothetical protein